jgi:hypothetical protein
MAAQSTALALRVLSVTDASAFSGMSRDPGLHYVNTLRMVADHAPNELAELDEEIGGLEERMSRLQAQRRHLSRLLSIANEYYEPPVVKNGRFARGHAVAN